MTRSLPPSPGLPGVPPEKRFAERRFEGPRRVKHGLKLSSREGSVARNPIAARWMQMIESLIPAETMQQGLEYARAGQIVSMQTLAGEIDARVQGTSPRAYTTRMMYPAVSEQQWPTLIEAMAGEAIHVAKLLGGELPPGLDEVFAAHNAALLPRAEALKTSCTCAAGTSGEVCKHIAAACHLFADQLSDQPLLIFTLLGMPAERLIERLRQARTLHTHGVASAHGDTNIPESQASIAPLESLLDDFWRGPVDLEEAAIPPIREPVKHALLRRLGPSPLQGKFPMVGLLASIYDAVSEAAKRKGEGGTG